MHTQCLRSVGYQLPTCMLQLRLEILGKSLFIHLLQADDVSMEAQQLLQDQGPPVVRVQEPAHPRLHYINRCFITD